jgi:predicted HicB family RNase H-like nuclease
MAKKSFKASVQESTSPATAFISQPTEDNAQTEGEPKQERKSVRVNLLFRPSTKANIEKLAFINKTSINDFINTVLDAYIEEHTEDIEKYDTFFNE